MVDAMGSVAQLVQVIQQQLAAGPAAGAGAAGAASTGRVSKTGKPATGKAALMRQQAPRYAASRLAELIGLRVRHIDPDDPQRGRKAFRVFLEAVLLSRLGEGLVNDPRFFQLVDDIQLAMEADGPTKALVARAIDQLLAEC